MTKEKLGDFIADAVQMARKESARTGRNTREILLEELRYITELVRLGVDSDVLSEDTPAAKYRNLLSKLEEV